MGLEAHAERRGAREPGRLTTDVKLVPYIQMWSSDHIETVTKPICHNFLKVVPMSRPSA